MQNRFLTSSGSVNLADLNIFDSTTDYKCVKIMFLVAYAKRILSVDITKLEKPRKFKNSTVLHNNLKILKFLSLLLSSQK